MTCTNSFLDNLKSKLNSIETPKIDLSEINSKIAEAQSEINDVIAEVNGFLDKAKTEVNDSLQKMMADIKNSKDVKEISAKIAEIKEKFGDAVGNLDDLIKEYSGGISEALKIGANNFDSDMKAGKEAIAKFLTGGFEFPDPCAETSTTIPNVEFTGEGDVIEKPQPPAVPAAKPADPPPKKKEQVNILSKQKDTDKLKSYGRAAREACQVGRKAIQARLKSKVAGEGSTKVGDTIPEPVKEALRVALLKRESSGNYSAVNSIHYVGGYQFGASALETIGYLKSGSSKAGNKAVYTDSNWTGKDGIKSLQDFYNSPGIQDKAFKLNCDFNFKVLKKLGTVTSDTLITDCGGYVAAAHLLGAGGASGDLTKTDAYGSKGTEYYNLGKNACTGISAGDTEFDSSFNRDLQENLYTNGMYNVWTAFNPVVGANSVYGTGLYSKYGYGDCKHPFRTGHENRSIEFLSSKYGISTDKLQAAAILYGEEFLTAANEHFKKLAPDCALDVDKAYVYYWKYFSGAEPDTPESKISATSDTSATTADTKKEEAKAAAAETPKPVAATPTPEKVTYDTTVLKKDDAMGVITGTSPTGVEMVLMSGTKDQKTVTAFENGVKSGKPFTIEQKDPQTGGTYKVTYDPVTGDSVRGPVTR